MNPRLQSVAPLAAPDQKTVTKAKVAVLAGDYIGPEVMGEALRVLAAVSSLEGIGLDLRPATVGGSAIDSCGAALPTETLALCHECDAILFGSVGGPKWDSLPAEKQPERAALLPLRRAFGLFANIRPGKLIRGLGDASPLKQEVCDRGIDIVVVRELTGGIYFGQPKGIDWSSRDPHAVDTMTYKVSEIDRIAEVACQQARTRAKRVCSVDKANVLASSRLWRDTVAAWFQRHGTDVELRHMLVDNAAMQLVRRPDQFDVILTENMFGDILSDELAGICGSLGMLASASIGDRANAMGRPFGLYEPAGGSAPDIAGRMIANPCAQILSAALMLRHSFGHEVAARRIEQAVVATIGAGICTADISCGRQPVGTREMAEAIIARL